MKINSKKKLYKYVLQNIEETFVLKYKIKNIEEYHIDQDVVTAVIDFGLSLLI
jgi:hypothetical protein